MKVVIIDYQMSNMFSVKNALDKVGIKNCISSDPNVLIEADGAILPGVGSFCEAMAKINDLKLNEAIINFIDSKRPFMGICLGLQLLFSESLEFKKTKGLNIIQGLVKKIESKQNRLLITEVDAFKNQTLEAVEARARRDLGMIAGSEVFYFVDVAKSENNVKNVP